MIEKYCDIAIIYGGSGKEYAEALNKRICEASRKERFPLKAHVIMEKILTEELLSGVIDLFRESEFCVIFLTADDCFETENGKVRRLRQNVVFELGMALMQLGRDRCFLLSDFDYKSPEFELPSDMKSLNIKRFNPDKLDAQIETVLEKILEFTPETDETVSTRKKIPQYKNLFFRDTYYVQYENIFQNRHSMQATEGIEFFREILDYWLIDCESLNFYDEKCMFLIERIGFLPIFGHIPEVDNFLKKAAILVESYNEEDIQYYNHNVGVLNYVKNLLSCVIEYTRIKTYDDRVIKAKYERLLRRFLTTKCSDERTINPLILVLYYDYLGLTYLKIHKADPNDELLDKALDSFQKAMEYVDKVDMSLRVWSGFLTFNIARVYSKMKDAEKMVEFFETSIAIREGWLRSSKYNITTRNALSYEYFLVRVYYIGQREAFHIITKEQMIQEYRDVENELNAYSDIDEKLDQLIQIRKMITERKAKNE